MEKVSWIEAKEFENPCYIESMGHPNFFPTPWREISMHEFFHRWMWCLQYIETRQITDREVINGGSMLAVHIMYFHNEALAVSHPSKWHLGNDEFGRHGVVWEVMPRFFRIGCEHDYDESNPYMFHHSYKCKKCGHAYAVDSSG